MAPRPVLQELARRWLLAGGQALNVQALGGVEAARRVAQGDPADVVVLAREAIDTLITEGHLQAGSCQDLMRSLVAVAWPAGQPAPDLTGLPGLQQALLAARRVAYSTGPSGQALLARLAQWGLIEQIKDKLVQAAPGVPVGHLLAQGQAELGFQQRSELMGLPDIEWALLPAEAEIVTVFSGALRARANLPESSAHWLAFCASAQAREVLLQHGMEPA